MATDALSSRAEAPRNSATGGSALLGRLVYNLWDIKDRSGRLAEYRALTRSQWWPAAQVDALQLERLNSMLDYAFRHSAFYQGAWNSAPQFERLGDLATLPLTRKADVRSRRDALVSDQYSCDELVTAKTGGSTGAALELYFDVVCQEKRNAASMRSDEWSGWRPGMLVAALWGTPPVPQTLKEKLRNALHDRVFYLDTMSLDDRSMREFASQIGQRRPGGLFGHAHSLFVFAAFVEKSGIRLPPFMSIVATSMMLLETERVVIERVFRCRVSNRYGCEEVGLIASECGHPGGMHINSEHVIVEIVRNDGSPVAPGEQGQIVVTDLLNHGMPLVRYAIEDVASWSAVPCTCGRTSPRLERLVGRVADFLVRRDGALVAGVSLVEKTLTAIPGVDQLQIVQTRIDQFELNCVPSGAYRESSEQALKDALIDAFGAGIETRINLMDRIPQEKNSKYRFAICRVNTGGGSR